MNCPRRIIINFLLVKSPKEEYITFLDNMLFLVVLDFGTRIVEIWVTDGYFFTSFCAVKRKISLLKL